MNEIRMITVKPKEGINVPLQDYSGHVLEAGQNVPYSPYYRRRIQDGDLIVVEKEQEQKASEASEAKVAPAESKKKEK